MAKKDKVEKKKAPSSTLEMTPAVTEALRMYRGLSLRFSDKVSGLFRIYFDFLDIEPTEVTYESIAPTLPKNILINHFKVEDKDVFIICELDMIKRFSLMMLGGDGNNIDKERTALTFTEKFMMREFGEWFQDLYGQQGMTAEVQRVETSLDFFHVFFPTDTMFLLKVNGKMKQDDCGQILIIHHKNFLDSFE